MIALTLSPQAPLPALLLWAGLSRYCFAGGLGRWRRYSL